MTKYTGIVDLWSIVHFMAGVVLAILGVHLLWIFVIGAVWEVIEHSILKSLANAGGREGIDNIISDIVFVFLGGALWYFL